MTWVHARSIDFHERNPWAITWVALSPQDEAFVYNEWAPSPSKWVNLSIAREVALKSGTQRYVMNLIDPLANKIQTNTGISVVEDLNRYFYEFKKEGICAGGYWEPFDTKGTKGYDEIKKRLKNSLLVKKPYNNRVMRDGREEILPTIWISNECRETAKSLKQWRYDERANNRQNATKDKNEKRAQKFSHFCTALEGIFKDNRFRVRREKVYNPRKGKQKFRVRS